MSSTKWVVVRQIGELREFYVSGQMPDAVWSAKLSDAKEFPVRPSVPFSGISSVQLYPKRKSEIKQTNPHRKRRGPPKGKVPPHLRRYLFKKGHR